MQKQLIQSSILVTIVTILLLNVPFAIISKITNKKLSGWTSTAVITDIGVLAATITVTISNWQNRQFSSLITILAERAKTLGSDRARTTLKPSGITKINRICELLNRNGDHIDRLIAAERQFASDASHQLRTPLTALSMRLEKIIQTDDPRIVKKKTRNTLTQVERLITVVKHLLDSVRDNNLRTKPIPLDHVVLQQIIK